jgi:transposase InsO family protein
MSRQNYYARRRERQSEDLDGDLIEALVRRERAAQSRLGGRKLLERIRPELKAAGIGMGRDRWFNVLRERDLLLEPLPRHPRTTDSRHTLPVFTNLIRDVVPDAPNQQWSADITYIRTDEGWMFAALIMDRYSRKIVGWDISDSLERDGCLRALRMALRGLVPGERPIHHSDRGCQYCCHEYHETLVANGLQASMTEDNHCYENAMSERLNGILKQEYGLGWTLPGKAQAAAMLAQAVRLYNHCRPHRSLKYAYPAEVHARKRKGKASA